jgi:voltage-gated anion channel
MLVGVIAANVLRVMDPSQSRAVGVLFVGYFFQGIGFFMAMFYICIYVLRCVSGFARILIINVKKFSLGQDHDGTSAH